MNDSLFLLMLILIMKKKTKDKKKKLEEFTKGWEDYRNSVIENKNKSQDDFEKYINILASGGIVLSLTFLEKIVTIDKVSFKLFFLFIIGLLLLIVTLLSNLYSHYKSIKDSDQIVKEIDSEQFDKIFVQIEQRNKIINILNKISIWSLIIGIILILSFVSVNLFYINKKENQNTISKIEKKTIPISDNQLETFNK